MPVAPLSAAPRGNSPARWATLLIVSLLLHLLAFHWVNEGWMAGENATSTDTPPVIAAALLPPPVPTAQPAPVQKSLSPSKPAAARAKPPPSALLPSSIPSPQEDTQDLPAMPAASAVSAVSAEDVQTPELAAESASLENDPQPAPTTKDTSLKVDPPPSAELHYQVQALRQGQHWRGDGVFRWEAEGGSYRASVEASIWLLFKITVLSSSSEGKLGDAGIQPVLYSEKPWRKSLMNTHFQHDARKITFSASEASYPYLGGEQDRASVVWQLAGIGRADAAQFVPGASFDLVVAGTRDAEPWQFVVQGEETVSLPDGNTQAWRVTRVPRSGSYDTRIDIWLAPERDWYPVRIRYTYKNADYLDLALKNLTPLARAAPQ